MNYELSSSEKTILNTIRKNNNIQKSSIVEKTNLPWSTVTSALQSLSQKGWIGFEKDGNRELVVLNSTSVYFVGVSVGSSNVKIVLTDLLCEKFINNNSNSKCEILNLSHNIELDFFNLSKDRGFSFKKDTNNCYRWCFVTPENYFDLSDLLTNICSIFLKHTENNNINLASICFVFPGTIDTNSQTIIKSRYSNQSIKETKIDYILDSSISNRLKQKNIRLYIDHNVKASTIFEYSDIKRNNSIVPSNMAVVYLGIGLGIGIVINGTLIRGHSNKAGQYGFLNISEYSDMYINDFFDNFEESEIKKNFENLTILEEILRKDVFLSVLESNESNDNKSIISIYKETSTDELSELINKSEAIFKKKLAFYLGLTISNIVKLLSIETFVFSGKLAKLYQVFQKELHFALMKFDTPVKIIASSDGEYSAAYGASEIAFENLFDIPDFEI